MVNMAVLSNDYIFTGMVGGNIATILAISGLVMFLKLYLPQRPSNVPPGPQPWPVFGNLWELSKDSSNKWPRLKQKYGDIFSVYMGSQLAVVLNSFDAIQEALVQRGKDFSDRPAVFFFQDMGELKGIAAASGDLWREQRKFTFDVLRRMGLGKRGFEEKIGKEIHECVKVVHSYGGMAFNIRHLVHSTTLNIALTIALGKRLNHDAPGLRSCLGLVDEIFKGAGNTRILNIVPWLRYLPGDITRHKKSIKDKEQLQQFLRNWLSDTEASYNCEDEPQNFAEAYLRKIKEDKHLHPMTNFEGYQLLKIMVDLVTAGTDPPASTIRRLLLYLIKYPDMQAKIQEEIDAVTGGNRSPCMEDISALPFTEAFISELQRYWNIPGLPHATSEDTYLRGYFVPKGTWVFPNLHEAFHDKVSWGDPEIFRPSRFLNDRGECVKPKQFMPFLIGRRMCLGESIATMEIFLFVTIMLQNFNFRLPDGAALPNLRSCKVVSTPEFEISAVRRGVPNSR